MNGARGESEAGPALGELAERLAPAWLELGFVRLAFLFGSRARGEARGASDFDLALLLEDETARAERGGVLRCILARLGRELASPHLDLVVLNDAPALLRHRVLRDGVVLHARTPEERPRFSRRTLRDYQDGAVRRDRFLKQRIERLKNATTGSTGATDGGSGDLLEAARRASRLLAEAARVSRG